MPSLADTLGDQIVQSLRRSPASVDHLLRRDFLRGHTRYSLGHLVDKMLKDGKLRYFRGKLRVKETTT